MSGSGATSSRGNAAASALGSAVRPSLLIDAHSPGPSGLGRYTQQMVQALARRSDFAAIYLAGDPDEMQAWIQGIEARASASSARGETPSVVTPLHIIPFARRRYSPLVPVQWHRVSAQVKGPQVTWFPHFDGAWTASPAVTTLHDIIHLADRSVRGRGRALVITQWMSRMIASSRALITGSAGSAERIASVFPEARAKMHVVPHGVAEIFHATGRSAVAPPPDEPGLPPQGSRYLLTVASKRPHKRLETAIRAYARLRAADATLRLVMVGPRDEHSTTLRSLAESLGVADGVDDLSGLSDAALAYTYKYALALLVPSREEGFGLVIIEAMAAGTPVIAVDAAPLPEVAGGAAVIVPYDDDAEMARAVASLDAPKLRALGAQRAAQFTWEEAAQRTARILLEARSEERGAKNEG